MEHTNGQTQYTILQTYFSIFHYKAEQEEREK